MKLNEKLNCLPIDKTLLFFEVFFEEYEKFSKSPQAKRYVISKYSEEDYVKLLGKKINVDEFKKEIKKMIPRTKFKVLMEFLSFSSEMKKLWK